MRAVFLLSLAASVCVVPGLAQSPTTTLNALHDTTRPLLIFAGADSAPSQQQLAGLASHTADVHERDVRVVLLDALHPQPHGDMNLPAADFSPAEQSWVRQRFRVAPGEFAVILVGKDGGEKLRSSKPITWEKLAATIDAMPMREDEIKQR